MFSPIPIDASPVHSPDSEVCTVEAAVPKFIFRAPELAEHSPVNEPFTRGGPRLRTREFFSREPGI
jgi:hypothetical protein